MRISAMGLQARKRCRSTGKRRGIATTGAMAVLLETAVPRCTRAVGASVIMRTCRPTRSLLFSCVRAMEVTE